ncbi:uncharacterized protein PITG_12920 [Phytophthora infestans T30-4]|uniref:Uncharacterized protein n=1 Tax=Phytophthora infestans (strain T30-4) TaxID=403677 RepID=D0NJV4_PHYIT|nr:uncharacterized protein PITG_12920 [Phytophthora infestans T30-4]EEY59791.1 hypothetical protein PITG_12920 [Phytophthora infestans T30-4]|eukprot:XP_002900476.1 hypothetical protein PITG_12920 [Phytophthora infestans T30-4]
MLAAVSPLPAYKNPHRAALSASGSFRSSRPKKRSSFLVFTNETSLQQIWRELKRKGWTFKKSTDLSNDQHYLPPGGSVNGAKVVHLFIAQVTPFRSEFLATSHEATGSPADVKAPSSEIAQTPPYNEGVEEQMPNPAAIHKSAAKESSASKDTSPAIPKVSFAKTRARQAPRPSKRICRWNDSDSANDIHKMAESAPNSTEQYDSDAENTSSELTRDYTRCHTRLGGVPLDDVDWENFLDRRDRFFKTTDDLDLNVSGDYLTRTSEDFNAGEDMADLITDPLPHQEHTPELTMAISGAKRRHWLCKVCLAFASVEH